MGVVRFCCTPAQPLPRALGTLLAGPAALHSLVQVLSEGKGALSVLDLSCVCTVANAAISRCCAGNTQLRPGALVRHRQAGHLVQL